MNYKRYIVGAVMVVFIALAVMAGCRQNKQNVDVPDKQPEPVQMHELSSGSNFVAQTREPVEVEADLFFPDRVEPVRTRIRIMPGTWVVPEQVLTMPKGDGAGEAVCNDRYCEVKQ